MYNPENLTYLELASSEAARGGALCRMEEEKGMSAPARAKGSIGKGPGWKGGSPGGGGILSSSPGAVSR